MRTELTTKMGFEESELQPCLLINRATDVMVVLHVDDFDVGGDDEKTEKFFEKLSGKVVLKTSAPIAPGSHGTFLGRKKVRTENGLFTAPSAKLVEEVLTALNLQECKPSPTPSEKLKMEQDDFEPLTEELASEFRTLTGKLLYIAKSRPDLAFAVKELARDIRNPVKRSIRKLRRLGRYLSGTRDLGIMQEGKQQIDKISVEAFRTAIGLVSLKIVQIEDIQHQERQCSWEACWWRSTAGRKRRLR